MGYSMNSDPYEQLSFPHHVNWQVAKLSLETGFMSEYIQMMLLETEQPVQVRESNGGAKEVCIKSFLRSFAPKVNSMYGDII